MDLKAHAMELNLNSYSAIVAISIGFLVLYHCMPLSNPWLMRFRFEEGNF